MLTFKNLQVNCMGRGRGRFTARLRASRILFWRILDGIRGGGTGDGPFRVVSDDFDVDEAAQVERLRSKLGHGGGDDYDGQGRKAISTRVGRYSMASGAKRGNLSR